MVGDLSPATRIGAVNVTASLAAIPRGRVIDLIDTDLLGFEAETDPLPVDAPAAVTLVIERTSSVVDIVEDVVAALADAVIDLFPAWLPGGEDLDGADANASTTLTELARRMAAGGGHSVAVVTMLARAGLSGRRRATDIPLETIARECTRLLSDAYGRDHVCLAVGRRPPGIVDADPEPWSVADQQAVATACEWLAQHADVAVCLLGDPLPDVDRFTPVRWVGAGDQVTSVDHSAPMPATGTDASVTAIPTRLRLPALAGQPHPNSAAEQRLHTFLTQLEWAVDARWNMTFAPDPLRAPIRVDIAWTQARCVVEIDGDDHRAHAKYAADRKRDNMLALAGFTVLRFTNDEVLADVSAVAATIERCLQQQQPSRTTTTTTKNDHREARRR